MNGKEFLGKFKSSFLWANLLDLFVLSFFPVTTGWVGRSGFALVPVQVYIFVNLLGAVSYYLLEKAVMQSKGNTALKDLIDEPRKERRTIMVEIISMGRLSAFMAKSVMLAGMNTHTT